MEKIIVITEMTENNLSAYLVGIDGIVAVGRTLSELKQSMKESIELYLETCMDLGLEIPEQLKGEYELVYKYDLRSFLVAYNAILNKSGLERITGVHQKQLWHYASGLKKPKAETVNRISESIHAFAKELQEVEFV